MSYLNYKVGWYILDLTYFNFPNHQHNTKTVPCDVCEMVVFVATFDCDVLVKLYYSVKDYRYRRY